MIDYDIVVLFKDDTRETVKVTAVSPVRAAATATYSMEKWDRAKQFQVVGLLITIPVRGAQIMPLPRPQLIRRRPAA
jgi:hypothetical protein